MRSNSDMEDTVNRYADTVKRICLVYMKNEADMEDIFQDVFLKYALFSGTFESEEHRKAWLIRVCVNRCKDLLKNGFRSRTCSLEEAAEMAAPATKDGRRVLEAVLTLPVKYRTPIYLFYYEGYSAAEIGRMTGKKENTVYTHLSRGKQALKELLGGEEIG